MTFSNLNIPGDIKYIYVKCYSDEDELNYIEMDHWQDDISCSATQRYCSLVYDINCEGGAGTLPAQQSIIYGGTAEVDTLSTITREGYSFSGWDRSAKAIYPEFLKKDTSQIVMDDDYVLYAVWRPLFSWNLKNLNEMNTLIGYINNYLNLTVSIINSDDYYKAEVYNNLNALLLGNQQVAQGELITLEQMNELMNLYNNFM